MHIRENQQQLQLENRHFKRFFGCLISYIPFHKTIQNFKPSTPKKEILIKKTLYTSSPAKINIKSVQVILSFVIFKFNLSYPLNFADT